MSRESRTGRASWAGRRCSGSSRAAACVREVDGTVAMALLSPTGAWDPAPVTTRVRWSSADPWLVELRFGPGEDVTCWTVALELLLEGCDAPAGLGDASLLPDPDTAGEHGSEVVELVLSSPTGHACFRVDVADLAEILDRITLGGATDLDAAGRPELVVATTASGWLDHLDDEIATFLADPRGGDGHPLGPGTGGGVR